MSSALVRSMNGSLIDEERVQICEERNKTTVSLTVVGPVPSMLSRLSTVMSHTRSTMQAAANVIPVNNNRSRVFTCHSLSFIKRLDEGPALVKVTYNDKDKQGIVTKIDQTHFLLNYLNSPIQTPSATLPRLKFLNPRPDDWIKTSDALSAVPKNQLKLNMAPPINSSPVQTSNHDDTTNDPFDYFLDKYFENLYMLTTPLTFFTKSVFARLKTLSVNDMGFYESILSQFLIKVDQFDARHLVSNNGLLNAPTLFEKEEIYRKGFVKKSLNLVDFDVHSTNFQETNRSLVSILDSFKVREMHLQMIILLELINITKRDDVKLFKKPKDKKLRKKKKNNLVGRKKLATVINGGAIPVSGETAIDEPTELTYNQLLDAYIDKLTIIDLLRAQGTSDHNAAKFINHIVIPYFDKSCPASVKYLIKKVKGPSFKPAVPAKQKKRTVSLTDVNSIKRPTLERTSSSSVKLEDIEELRGSMRRSNSDLSALKRTSSFTGASLLSKRQVDMSLPAPVEPRALKKTNSQIFNRVGKKITSSALKLTTSVSQVEATPMKKTKVVDVMQTPADSKTEKGEDLVNSVEQNNSIHSSSPLVQRTPMQPSLESPIAIRSTVRKPGDPIDMSDRFMGSPVAKNVKRRLFAPPRK